MVDTNKALAAPFNAPPQAAELLPNHGKHSAHQSWMSWRDASTGGALRILEITWVDASGRRSLTILDYRDYAVQTLVGPELGDVELLALDFDVKRFDAGLGTLHMDPDLALAEAA